jgi:hypothetical protein
MGCCFHFYNASDRSRASTTKDFRHRFMGRLEKRLACRLIEMSTVVSKELITHTFCNGHVG